MNHRNLYWSLLYSCLILGAASCLEPYNPPAIQDTVDILVVDGFINSTDSSVSVTLSKATALADPAVSSPELNAFVSVEEENGNSYPLIEMGEGNFNLPKLNLNLSKRYRLHILASNEKEYFSDFIDINKSPPIDSITWRPTSSADGLTIFVNTHDDTKNTRYYQWTFQETWEYNSSYYSSFKIRNGEVLNQDLNINTCWITKASTEINVASTVQLDEDIIRDFPLLFIAKGSQKLSRKYSMEVQQRALTKEAYDFWVQLEKTTENLGGLFDPLPGQVLGNLHSEDDTLEPVLGYFSGGYVSKKRLFISFYDLPTEIRSFAPRYCSIDTIFLDMIPDYPDANLITSFGMFQVEGYLTTSEHLCLDCRDDGGDIIRPDFWE